MPISAAKEGEMTVETIYFNIFGQQTAQNTANICSVIFANELNKSQRSSWAMNIQTFRLQQQQVEKINAEIRIIENMIKSFIKMYIFDEKMTSSTRKIIQTLTAKYKRSSKQIIEQLQKKYFATKTSSAKNKIKQ